MEYVKAQNAAPSLELPSVSRVHVPSPYHTQQDLPAAHLYRYLCMWLMIYLNNCSVHCNKWGQQVKYRLQKQKHITAACLFPTPK